MRELQPKEVVARLLACGYSQADLATAAGVTQACISKIASGHIKNPAYITIARLLPLLLCGQKPQATKGGDECRTK